MSKSAQRLWQGVGVREVCPTFWPTATFLGRYQCLTGSRMVLTSKRQRLRRGHPSPLPACPWLSRPHLSKAFLPSQRGAGSVPGDRVPAGSGWNYLHAFVTSPDAAW